MVISATELRKKMTKRKRSDSAKQKYAREKLLMEFLKS